MIHIFYVLMFNVVSGKIKWLVRMLLEDWIQGWEWLLQATVYKFSGVWYGIYEFFYV